MNKKKLDNDVKIVSAYGFSGIREISVDWNAWNFLIIYGKHVNGWFVAIPNWNVSAEIGNPGNLDYNIGNLSDAFARMEHGGADCGTAIAKAIQDDWERMNRA